MSELGKIFRAFNGALDEIARHPLKALRDWWAEATECPVCGPDHGRRHD